MLQPLLRPLAVAANDRFYGASPISLPRPPILDLDFVGRPSLQYPGLPPISFLRASTATYRDASGTRRVAAVNEPRFDHDRYGNLSGLLIEGSNTNFLLNSTVPVTQTTGSLSTGTYTVWCEGTGSVAVAGNTATITGAGTATEGSPVTFVVTVAGTVTVMVSGTVTAFQLENFADVSSLIITGGATATRSNDIPTVALSAIPFNRLFGAVFVEAVRPRATTGAATLMEINSGSGTDRINMNKNSNAASGQGIRFNNREGGVTFFNADSGAISSPMKAATAWRSGASRAAANGSMITSTTNNTFGSINFTTLLIGHSAGPGSYLNGAISRLQLFTADIPDAKLLDLTN